MLGVYDGHLLLGKIRVVNYLVHLGSSGVAKLRHTGARALATRGCAPPVRVLLKIIVAECSIINRELGAKSAQRHVEIELRSIAICTFGITRSRMLP